MHICFTAIGSGFANNGGTKTIYSCANILHILGHEISLASTNYDFTWFPTKAQKLTQLPTNADIIIATAVHTIKPLLKHKTKARKIWYIRGWETWAEKEEKIINLTKEIDIIVNSEWLQEKVAQHTKKPPIIYPGLDTHIYYKEEKTKPTITIGGLYHKKDLKRFDLWLDIIKEIKKQHNIKINLFGNDQKPALGIDFHYLQQPNEHQHRQFYNECDIWLFTSNNEGLHIPPMEAGLCGCTITGTEIGGVKDYAIHNQTALLGNNQIMNITKLIADSELRNKLSENLMTLLRIKIGTRIDNMKKLVKLLR